MSSQSGYPDKSTEQTYSDKLAVVTKVSAGNKEIFFTAKHYL